MFLGSKGYVKYGHVCSYSSVLLGFHPNPRFLENSGGKILKGTR